MKFKFQVSTFENDYKELFIVFKYVKCMVKRFCDSGHEKVSIILENWNINYFRLGKFKKNDQSTFEISTHASFELSHSFGSFQQISSYILVLLRKSDCHFQLLILIAIMCGECALNLNWENDVNWGNMRLILEHPLHTNCPISNPNSNTKCS